MRQLELLESCFKRIFLILRAKCWDIKICLFHQQYYIHDISKIFSEKILNSIMDHDFMVSHSYRTDVFVYILFYGMNFIQTVGKSNTIWYLDESKIPNA